MSIKVPIFFIKALSSYFELVLIKNSNFSSASSYYPVSLSDSPSKRIGSSPVGSIFMHFLNEETAFCIIKIIYLKLTNFQVNLTLVEVCIFEFSVFFAPNIQNLYRLSIHFLSFIANRQANIYISIIVWI